MNCRSSLVLVPTSEFVLIVVANLAAIGDGREEFEEFEAVAPGRSGEWRQELVANQALADANLLGRSGSSQFFTRVADDS